MPVRHTDTTQTTIAERMRDLTVQKEPFKTLDASQAHHHLWQLGKALDLLTRMITEKLPSPEAEDQAMMRHLTKLTHTIKALSAKSKIDDLQSSGASSSANTIHPADSGFPVFYRELSSLRNDKQDATARLSELPSDNELVDAALFKLFRDQYPAEEIQRKFLRNYYGALQRGELPMQLQFHVEKVPNRKSSGTMYKISVERLDDMGDIPLFYSAYLRIPDSFVEVDWKNRLEEAIRMGMGTVRTLELPYLARLIEKVPGVILDMIERYTIGPFYNRHTDNTKAIAELIQNEDDFILMFQKSTVLRADDKKHRGVWDLISGLFTGDRSEGVFTPALQSPRYVLLPHRMIQKVHNHDISLGGNIKMYGYLKEGGLLD
jgi:hypothetical protein